MRGKKIQKRSVKLLASAEETWTIGLMGEERCGVLRICLMTALVILSGLRAEAALPEETAAPEFVVPPRPAGPFQLIDGDRVLFLGDTLIERAQNSDYLETLLTLRYPERNIIFRNLGWSGDTVYGDARAGFGTAADGFEQLREQVYALQPTVMFVAYGGNSSFDGPAGLERFEKGYHTLLDMLEVTRAEIILLAPVRHEDLGRPLPDPTAHNTSLELYSQAIGRIAADRRHRFIDLLHELSSPAESAGSTKRQLTENGIHLSPYGYWRLARTVERGLGLCTEPWQLTLDRHANRVAASGFARESRIEEIRTAPSSLQFSMTEPRLPDPMAPQYPEVSRLVTIQDLPPGRYTLRIDGRPIHTAAAETWGKGVSLHSTPEFDQVAQLRNRIMAKNRLYFYRWRPQNETYLFGFRKHEQGQNAKEVPMFDPLVAAQEEKIATLRVPKPHLYELAREK